VARPLLFVSLGSLPEWFLSPLLWWRRIRVLSGTVLSVRTCLSLFVGQLGARCRLGVLPRGISRYDALGVSQKTRKGFCLVLLQVNRYLDYSGVPPIVEQLEIGYVCGRRLLHGLTRSLVSRLGR
jgi:hypothetical protein